MSYKTIINSKGGIRVQRLGENLWSAQPYVNNLFTTPKIQFSLDHEDQIVIKKYDLLRPSLIHSMLFTLIFLICEFVFRLNILSALRYLILGSTVFHFGLMSLLIYVAKVRIQSQLKPKK